MRHLRTLLIGLASAVILGAAAAEPAVPDFSGFWNHGVPDQEYENPPEGGPGPTRNIVGQERWHGDFSNPNLKPWAAAQVKKNNEVFNTINQARTAQERCALYGVPNILTSLGTLQILQEPKMVTFFYQ